MKITHDRELRPLPVWTVPAGWLPGWAWAVFHLLALVAIIGLLVGLRCWAGVAIVSVWAVIFACCAARLAHQEKAQFIPRGRNLR